VILCVHFTQPCLKRAWGGGFPSQVDVSHAPAIGFNGEVSSMLRHSADTNEARHRLEDLHRRVLRSQRLKVKLQETRGQPWSDESPPDPLTQKRINDINSSHPNCQRNAAVDLHLQLLAHGHACFLSSDSVKERNGHWKVFFQDSKKMRPLWRRKCA
jgi:hypothetical protein